MLGPEIGSAPDEEVRIGLELLHLHAQNGPSSLLEQGVRAALLNKPREEEILALLAYSLRQQGLHQEQLPLPCRRLHFLPLSGCPSLLQVLR